MSESGGMVHARRGSIVEKRKAEDTEAYRAMIESLHSEKAHDLSRTLRNKLNLLQDFVVEKPNPHRETLNEISKKVVEYKIAMASA